MLVLINSLTALLNHWFAAPLVALLTKLGIHVAHPSRPIGNSLTLQLIVMTLMLLFFVAARLSLNVEKPGTIQHTAEVINEFVEQPGGPGYRPRI